MKLVTVLAAASLLSLFPVSQANADDLDMTISVLAQTIGRVKALSEACNIAVDPMLEGRVVETLIQVPSIYMSDVVTHFAQVYQIQKHSSGDRCYPETPSQIESAMRLYDLTIKDLRQYVEKNNGQ